MTTVSPFIFKSQAIRALKGNWQTALLVSFFAALPLTVVQLLQATRLPDLASLSSYEAMVAAARAVPQETWTLLGVAGVITFLVTPVLAVGCNYYFIRRLYQEELGFGGLFSRVGVAGKALWLYLLMYVKTFLWSLLLVVPGVMAMLRYSMAPFYLAEHPEMSVREAMAKSKAVMKDKKTSYLLLQLSFVSWLLAALLSEIALYGVSPILGMVASQFIQLFMATYLNAASASFYKAASVTNGMQAVQNQARQWLEEWNRQRGGNGSLPRDFGNDTADAPDEGDAEEPANADEEEALGNASTQAPPKDSRPPKDQNPPQA